MSNLHKLQSSYMQTPSCRILNKEKEFPTPPCNKTQDLGCILPQLKDLQNLFCRSLSKAQDDENEGISEPLSQA